MRVAVSANLASKAARRRLKAEKTHWSAVSPGLFLGYRRPATGAGIWWWRQLRKPGSGAYDKGSLRVFADDVDPADGIDIMSYEQAQERVRQRSKDRGAEKAAKASQPVTVKRVCADYVRALADGQDPPADGQPDTRPRGAIDTEQRLAKHVLPRMGDVLVAQLRTKQIEAVKTAMVKRSAADPEVERKSKDTANRVLSMLKAALNRAFKREDEYHLQSDAAWRRVGPWNGVSKAREVHLDMTQVKRLLNTTAGTAIGRLITAALLTGARPPHELIALRVQDFHREHRTMTIRGGKTGGRTVTLTAEAAEFFAGIAAGKHPDDLLLPRDDGSAWGRADHIRPFREAAERAKLPADCTIYSMRHTHISDAIIAGMPLTLLAENCGTSVRMIEVNYAKAIAATRREFVESHGYKLGLAPSNVKTLG
jgi:integrase